MGDRDNRTAKLELTGPDWHLQAEITVPAGPARLRTLLPVIHSLTDVAADIAVKRVERQGQAISCKKGCAACCRQLVPVSQVEAQRIGEIVAELPEPARSQIRRRFAAARDTLDRAGLLQELEQLDQRAAAEIAALGRKYSQAAARDTPDRAGLLEELERLDQRTAAETASLGLKYFQLGIPCPFLEQELCSIYPDRPVACRGYLVTSPAANCAQPTQETVRRVPLPLKVSDALRRCEADAGLTGRPLGRVPLVLAPAWAEAHPQEGRERLATQWVEDLIEGMTGKKA